MPHVINNYLFHIISEQTLRSSWMLSKSSRAAPCKCFSVVFGTNNRGYLKTRLDRSIVRISIFVRCPYWAEETRDASISIRKNGSNQRCKSRHDCFPFRDRKLIVSRALDFAMIVDIIKLIFSRHRWLSLRATRAADFADLGQRSWSTVGNLGHFSTL